MSLKYSEPIAAPTGILVFVFFCLTVELVSFFLNEIRGCCQGKYPFHLMSDGFLVA